MPTLDIAVAEAPPLTMLSDGGVRIRGTRVSLDTVVHAFNQGCTPEQITMKYPTLQLVDIYAVIAFYLRHRDDVHVYLEERSQKAEEIRRRIAEKYPPDGFRERLLARREQMQKQK
jgi:uncharacterized protein (DUF433 family)